MGCKYEKACYEMLSDSPVTPNEVAQKLKTTQKTAQKTLMMLALTKEDVKYKASGRIHIFWRTKPQNHTPSTIRLEQPV